jgi:hypothetical protein
LILTSWRSFSASLDSPGRFAILRSVPGEDSVDFVAVAAGGQEQAVVPVAVAVPVRAGAGK